MANVFTTDFRYKGMTYSALVSTRTTGDDHAVYVQIYDKDLHHLAPDGELNFRISKTLRKAADPKTIANNELVQSIREAVINHMKPSAEMPDPY